MTPRVAQYITLGIVVIGVCILSIYDALKGEAATMLGMIVGYLTQTLHKGSTPE